MKHPINLVILTPVYNDWDCLDFLSSDITKAIEGEGINLRRIIVVNDHSNESMMEGKVKNLPVDIVNLGTNVGHQRAIAIGLCYINEHFPEIDVVVVMDSDGEDLPSNIPELASKAHKEVQIVFAERRKRSESLSFQIGYQLYKILFRVLTGQTIKFGNFSAIPSSKISPIIRNPDLWNHYSASILKANHAYTSVPTKRGKRYRGQSKMNTEGLVIHGLSSIAIYTDKVIARLLIFITQLIFMIFITGITILLIKFLTELAIPGWTSNIIASIINLTVSLFSIILILLLIQLNQRKQAYRSVSSFYNDFIESIQHNGRSK